MISKETPIGTKVWNSTFGNGEYLGISKHTGHARVKFDEIKNIVIIEFRGLLEVTE